MIYLIIGTSGEYSDRCEWVVGYSASLEMAEKYKEELEKTYKLSEEKREAVNGSEWGWYSHSHITPGEGYIMLRNLDPKFQHDYTGTEYCIEPVEEINAPQESEN